MKTFELEGKHYKEAPERTKSNRCLGCAFDGGRACFLYPHSDIDVAVFGGSCADRKVIYILAEDAPKQSKIEKAKAALKAAIDALDELEVEE